jgi:hypothetical protein
MQEKTEKIGLIQGNGRAGWLKTWLMLVQLLFWF